jgi:3D (Asp-Asp-Asp) domain-containing protein
LPSLAAAQNKNPAPDPQVRQNLVLEGVRTTAYTHTEKDHIKYGARTAAGTALKFGAVRSAAADWSIYPVGTVFQIEGNPALYVVDDYGSALVGTRTIDLYKPSLSYVSRWGVRRVNITILKWGSFAKSLAILKPRESKAPHVRKMVARLEARSA